MEKKLKADRNYGRIERAIEYLAKNRLNKPNLAEVSKVVGLSEFHFQRIFKQWAGVSPKNLLQYLTLEDAKIRLSENLDLMNTSLEVGMSGSSRLHDLFVKLEGMTPGEYKQKGNGLTVSFGFVETPFGTALIGATARGVCHLHFVTESKKRALIDLKKRWPLSHVTENRKLAQILNQRIFIKQSPVDVFAIGTPFQIKVWEALLRIPEGLVHSYRDLARMIGMPNATRAVASAVASNEICWIVPCHRVIKANGLIGEYRWGAGKKKSLLCYEAARSEEK